MDTNVHATATTSTTPSYLVGTLSLWNPQTGTVIHDGNGSKRGSPMKIYSDEEVYIGRDKRKCKYILDNPMISNRHLRIYTIIFDRENPQDVAPLVYAQDLSMNGTLWNGFPMGGKVDMGMGRECSSSSFLLSDGDVLGVAPCCLLRFSSCDYRDGHGHLHGDDDEDISDCFDALQRTEMEIFQDRYTITPRKLGSGAYGQVHMAIDRKNGRQLACKVIDLRVLRNRIEKLTELKQKSSKFFDSAVAGTETETRPSIRIDENGTAKVVAVRQQKGMKMELSVSRDVEEKLKVYDREAKILETLCHPNIIGMEKVIKSSNTMYLFQDLVTAGDLFSFIEYKGGRLGCIEAAVIIRQILMALDYLHDRNIVHRDLKPDNILMTSLADGCRVVLTDFGCARLVRPKVERMSTVVGTLEYSAPEVLKASRGGYTKAVDLWSLGCITVVLLTGGSPFVDPTTATYSEEQVHECDLKKLEAELDWNKAGKRAKDFIRRLLVLEETRRMNVKQALRHCWFTNPVYKRELEELYKRSIRGWKPRIHKEPLIVDLSDIIPYVDQDQNKEEAGQYSESPLPSLDTGSSELSNMHSSDDLEHGGLHDYNKDDCSFTLSDPELPELSRGERTMKWSRSSQRSSNKNRVPSPERFPISSDPWMIRSETGLSIQNKDRDSGRIDDGTGTKGSCTSGESDLKWTTTCDRAEKKKQPSDTGSKREEWYLLKSSGGNPTTMTINNNRKRWRYSSSSTEASGDKCNGNTNPEEEVYEEVSNLVTGKRQRVIYGANILAEAMSRGMGTGAS